MSTPPPETLAQLHARAHYVERQLENLHATAAARRLEVTLDDLLAFWLDGYDTGVAHGRADRQRDARALAFHTEVVVPIVAATIADLGTERARQRARAEWVPPTPKPWPPEPDLPATPTPTTETTRQPDGLDRER